MKRIAKILFGISMVSAFAAPAAANEYTDVIDAFDKEIGDPFDLNLRVGYQREYEQGLIRREDFRGTPHEWDAYAYTNMFEFERTAHILDFELDIGLYKDISLRVGLPLVLNDTRELRARQNMQWADVNGIVGGDELFALPFKSPERSGVDHIEVGLWWGILDQSRDDTKPNWTVFAEGRFAVGDKLQAACDKYGSHNCSGEDYQYTAEDGTRHDVDFNTKGGISRGVNELRAGTRLSRRYGWLDPYFGFEALIGWPQEGAAYQISGNAAGQINDMPPVVGRLDFGLEFIPWDVPELHRKLVIGLGGGAMYHSEGREYTPLFDALGTSPYFTTQEYVDFNGNGQRDPGEAAAIDTWEGITDVENYATFYGQLFVSVQPAKYIKLRVGSNLGHETEHFITKTDQCPADQMQSDGTCAVYNYGHRPELDAPGNRFRAEQTLLWTLFVDLIAQF
jgi:hypothetical protein